MCLECLASLKFTLGSTVDLFSSRILTGVSSLDYFLISFLAHFMSCVNVKWIDMLGRLHYIMHQL
jgi:hypothetical protein